MQVVLLLELGRKMQTLGNVLSSDSEVIIIIHKSGSISAKLINNDNNFLNSPKL